MSPQILLAHLIRCEQRVRKIYLALGDRATFPAEMRFFWNCMAEDERHHVAILERSAGLLDLIEIPPQITEDTLARIEAKIATAEAVTAQSDLTSDEALRQAILLEGSELNSMDAEWFRSFRSMLGSILKAMAPEDEVHLRRLIEAVHEFGTDDSLKDQAATLWSARQ